MIPLIAALGLALGISDAEASSKPYMWGVGPTLSTIAFPGQYPFTLPDEADGKVDKVGGDVGIGARGVLYLKKHDRLGARLMGGFGGGIYSSVAFTLEYDKMLMGSHSTWVFAGGGLGFGRQRFASNERELAMATYNLRAQLGAHYRSKKANFELALFLAYLAPGVQKYTGTGGNERQVKGGFYPQLGLEASVMFGDFTPPKKKKKKSGGGKK